MCMTIKEIMCGALATRAVPAVAAVLMLVCATAWLGGWGTMALLALTRNCRFGTRCAVSMSIVFTSCRAPPSERSPAATGRFTGTPAHGLPDLRVPALLEFITSKETSVSRL